MTCTTCTDFAIAETKPSGIMGRLLAALGRLLPEPRLDVESLSAHQLRDLGLADGRTAPYRDLNRD